MKLLFFVAIIANKNWTDLYICHKNTYIVTLTSLEL